MGYHYFSSMVLRFLVYTGIQKADRLFTLMLRIRYYSGFITSRALIGFLCSAQFNFLFFSSRN